MANAQQEFASMSLAEIATLLDRKETSSAEITGIMLERAEASQNNAYTYIHEEALKAAAEADSRRQAGKALGLVDGVPMALKDDYCVKGLKMTCASRMLADYKPLFTGTVAEKLENAGGVLLGKLNMDEFAVGNSTEGSYFGMIKNPAKSDRTAGGSSGGSAAVVAEDTAYFTMGSDTGGDIRQPASFCGVVGLKPTYGLVSRYGIAACASSFDQAGPLCKTVEDCAILLSLIAGHDPKDPCTVQEAPPDYRAALKGAEGLKGLRFGVPKNYMGSEIHVEIRQSILNLVDKLLDAGALVEECTLQYADYALAAHYTISSAEFNSNMARYDGVKFGFRAFQYSDYNDMLLRTRGEGFGDEVKRRILFGIYTLSGGRFSEYYLKAQKVRALIRDDYTRIFGKYDLLLTPTSPVTAWPLGASLGTPSQAYATRLCTVPANLAGLPAISVPWSKDKDGMPIGAQLVGPALSEALILQAAQGVEALSSAKGDGKDV